MSLSVQSLGEAAGINWCTTRSYNAAQIQLHFRDKVRDHSVIEPETIMQYVYSLLFRIDAIHVGGETYVEVAIGNVVEFYAKSAD